MYRQSATATRVVAVALMAAIFAVVLAVSRDASAAPARPSANVTAYDASGHKLPPNPELRSALRIVIKVSGFAAGVSVMVQFPGISGTASIVAGAGGVAALNYSVPASLPNGQYSIVFSGQSPPEVAQSGGPTSQPTRSGDRQHVSVSVPDVGVFPFRKHDPGSSSSSSNPASGSASGTSGSTGPGSPVSDTAISIGGGGGHLGGTGVDVVGLLLAAAIAIVGGLLIMVPGRRRKHS